MDERGDAGGAARGTRAVLRVADLPAARPTPFRLEPDAEARAVIARDLGLVSLRKMRLEGEMRPTGAGDWTLDAHLGASAVQSCVVTLEPVTTRVEEPVRRVYAAHHAEPEAAEVEMPDDEREPLPAAVDLLALASEALALALPEFPRAADAELGEAVFADPGVEPLTDEAARPFAGLRDKLARD